MVSAGILFDAVSNGHCSPQLRSDAILMHPESPKSEEIIYSRDEVLKPWLINKSWRPRFTLGNFILFVVIIALGAAYYAKSNEFNAEKEKYATQLQRITTFNAISGQALDTVTRIPSQLNFGFVHVYAERASASSIPQNSILVYLDPEKDYLLRFANQDIPLRGVPAAKTTYHIKSIGDRRDSRNFIRFEIDFLGTGYHYDDYEHPFEGIFVIHYYSANFSGTGAGKINYKSGYLSRIDSNPVKINKDKKIHDWVELLLEHGRQTGNLSVGSPTQLARIRSNPSAPEPCPGVMLWIEELGDKPVPMDALPFQSRP